MTQGNGSGAAGSAPAARVAVVGLGNVLMGDDALGPYVARVLNARYEFAPGVLVQDLGTPGLDLTPFLAGLDAVILVDTVHSDAPAGTLKRYRRDDVLRHPPPQRVSPHDPGIKETLLTLEFAGRAPAELLLVGVVPHDTGMRTGLAPPVQAAVPAVLAAVGEELARLGVPMRERRSPGDPDLWWERTP